MDAAPLIPHEGRVVAAQGTAGIWIARPATAAQEHELAAGMAGAGGRVSRTGRAVPECGGTPCSLTPLPTDPVTLQVERGVGLFRKPGHGG